MSEILKQLLDSGNYITVNKLIIKKLGLLEAVLLGDLISKYNYFSKKNMLTENDEFFNTIKNIIEDTGITRHQLNQTFNTLKDYNILEITKKGLPAKNYYKLNFDKIECIFTQSTEKHNTSEPKISRLDTRKSVDINNNKNNNNKDNNIYNNIITNQLDNSKELSNDCVSNLKNRIIENKKEVSNNILPITNTMLNLFYNSIINIYSNIKKEDIYSKKEINIVNNKIKSLLKGFPKEKYSYLYSKDFLEESKIDLLPYLEKGIPKEKLLEIYKDSLLVYNIDYYPIKKNNLPKKLSYFITRTGKNIIIRSPLLFYGLNKTKTLLQLKNDPNPEITKKIKKQLFQDKTWTIKENNSLITAIQNMWEKIDYILEEKIKSKYVENKYYTRVELDKVLFKNFGDINKFTENFILFIHNTQDCWEKLKINYSIFNSMYWWNKFNEWCIDELGVNLEEKNLNILMSLHEADLISRKKIILPEKSIKQKVKDINLALRSTTKDSANYEILSEEKERLLKKLSLGIII